MTTSENAQRDELAAIYVDTLNRGHGVIDRPEQGLCAADAVLAAGYRKPRTITTVAELNRLPVFSVIRIQQGKTLERLSDGWYMAALEDKFTAFPIWLPATVIHEPEAEVGA